MRIKWGHKHPYLLGVNIYWNQEVKINWIIVNQIRNKVFRYLGILIKNDKKVTSKQTKKSDFTIWAWRKGKVELNPDIWYTTTRNQKIPSVFDELRKNSSIK